MRHIKAEQKGIIEYGMKGATERLVDDPNSPLLLGATIGLACIVDGPEAGMHFVTDVQRAQEFDEGGFPPELWLAYADFLDEMALGIRAGRYDAFLKQYDPTDGTDGEA